MCRHQMVHWLVENEQAQLIADALGVSSTGLDAWRSYQQLVHRETIHPQVETTTP